MNWLEPRDEYCERIDAAFWSEPLNAISNLAFVLGGLFMLYRSLRKGRDIWLEILCLWVIVIGVGSFLYHTFANRWAELADVVPIWSFVLAYLIFVLRRLYRLSAWRVVRVIMITVLITGGIVYALPSGSGGATNGSLQYLPAVIALFGFAIAHKALKKEGSAWVLAAAATFTLSLVFRTFDQALCAQFPNGVHFMWHILNGTMLAFLLKVAVDYGHINLHQLSSPSQFSPTATAPAGQEKRQ